MDEAYLTAVMEGIRTAYSLDLWHCDVTPDGKAHPDAGEWYYAVHPGSLTNSAQNYRKDTVGLYVTLTLRTDSIPQDRIGQEAVLGREGIIARAKALAALVNMNYEMMDRANELLTAAAGAAGASPFYLPLQFMEAAYLGPKGPDWFFAEGQEPTVTGLAVQLSFGRAERVQYLETQT